MHITLHPRDSTHAISLRRYAILTLTTWSLLCNSSLANELKELEQRIKKVVNSALPATVAITDGRASGSGVIVSEDGLVLTAGHVVMSDAEQVDVIFSNGRRVKAKPLGKNLDVDVGMVQITTDGKWPHVPVGKSENLQRGQWCVAIGNPGGFKSDRTPPVRAGRVLAVSPFAVISDCTVVVGDSGGPLLDLDGKVIGIHSMIGPMIVQNRHVAIDAFRADWERLKKRESRGSLPNYDPMGRITPFGARVDWFDFKATVTDAAESTAAAQAGIQVGDVIARIDGKTLADAIDMFIILANRQPGDDIKVDVQRGAEMLRMDVTIRQFAPPAKFNPWEHRPHKGQVLRDRKVGTHEKANVAWRQSLNSLFGPRMRGTVAVICEGQPICLGAIVSDRGHIITKASEISVSKPIQIRFHDDWQAVAEIVATDRQMDLLLLKAEIDDFLPVEWTNDDSLAVGSLLVTSDHQGKVLSTGVVSVKARQLHGNEQAFLGIRTNRGNDGVIVYRVIADSAAFHGGLRRNDVILAFKGQKVTSEKQLAQTVRRLKPGETVKVVYRRGFERRETEIKLAGRFVSGETAFRFNRARQLGTELSERNDVFPLAVQHDTMLLPEMCGGPVFDTDGRAVGINIARSSRVSSYLIPASEVKSFLQKTIGGRTDSRNGRNGPG